MDRKVTTISGKPWMLWNNMEDVEQQKINTEKVNTEDKGSDLSDLCAQHTLT